MDQGVYKFLDDTSNRSILLILLSKYALQVVFDSEENCQ